MICYKQGFHIDNHHAFFISCSLGLFGTTSFTLSDKTSKFSLKQAFDIFCLALLLFRVEVNQLLFFSNFFREFCQLLLLSSETLIDISANCVRLWLTFTGYAYNLALLA
jgi:hypothetical protein